MIAPPDPRWPGQPDPRWPVQPHHGVYWGSRPVRDSRLGYRLPSGRQLAETFAEQSKPSRNTASIHRPIRNRPATPAVRTRFGSVPSLQPPGLALRRH
jgi:hypothetical protein